MYVYACLADKADSDVCSSRSGSPWCMWRTSVLPNRSHAAPPPVGHAYTGLPHMTRPRTNAYTLHTRLGEREVNTEAAFCSPALSPPLLMCSLFTSFSPLLHLCPFPVLPHFLSSPTSSRPSLPLPPCSSTSHSSSSPLLLHPPLLLVSPPPLSRR